MSVQSSGDAVARLSSALADRYRIERELGQGGMATVYLAEDLKHDRKVALKVLKPELAAVLGAERFVQEIKTTASLQHPNILPLFDSGTVERSTGETEFLYYVMPFIEGETLREKLNRETQLGIDEAVKIATEVAEALDAAHHEGVIHRDIKPENILLHNGRPMVADFGIALAVSAAAGGRMTETGLSLGTPHYMSPEQATAEKDLTPRSDVYSLGSVLYEMLTGEPPHSGGSAQAIIMKIVTEPASSVTKIRKSVPPNVTAAVAKSLEKLAADRFESAKAFVEALANPTFTLPTTSDTWVESTTRASSRLTGLFATLAVVFAVAFGWSMLTTDPEVAKPVNRFRLAHDLPNFETGALAPDGSFHVFPTAGADGRTQLFVRRWADLDPTPIPGTEGATGTGAVSPNGNDVAFHKELPGPLFVTAIEGGPARQIVEFQWGASEWDANGMVYFTASSAAGVGAGINRVPATGGQVETVTELHEGELAHGGLHVLPSAQSGLFTVWHAIDGTDAEIWAIDFNTGDREQLVVGQRPYYAATGHLVFVTPDGRMMVALFDAETLELTGAAVPIIESVMLSAFFGLPLYTIADSGTLIYRPGMDNRTLPVWIDRQTAARDLMVGWRGAVDPAFSPDGERLAVSRDGDISIVPLDGSPTTQLTFGEGRNLAPTWSPDGQTVFFLSDRAASVTGHNDVFSIRADGSGEAELFFESERGLVSIVWSPNGDWLLLTTSFDGPSSSDILGLQAGASEAVPLLASRFPEVDPAVSPDGRWLAYAAQGGVVVVPFPNTDDARWPLAGLGSGTPVWRASGRELFYVQRNSSLDSLTLRIAQLGSGEAFSVVSRESLTSHRSTFTFTRPYAVTPDGRRVLVMETGSQSQGELVLVQNFFEELKALGR